MNPRTENPSEKAVESQCPTSKDILSRVPPREKPLRKREDTWHQFLHTHPRRSAALQRPPTSTVSLSRAEGPDNGVQRAELFRHHL